MKKSERRKGWVKRDRSNLCCSPSRLLGTNAGYQRTRAAARRAEGAGVWRQRKNEPSRNRQMLWRAPGTNFSVSCFWILAGRARALADKPKPRLPVCPRVRAHLCSREALFRKTNSNQFIIMHACAENPHRVLPRRDSTEPFDSLPTNN